MIFVQIRSVKIGVTSTTDTHFHFLVLELRVEIAVILEVIICKTMTTQKTNEELVEWDRRCLEIAVMADKGDDKAYGPALARLARDIRQALATKDAAWEERMRDAYISGYDAGKHDATTPPLPDQGDSK